MDEAGPGAPAVAPRAGLRLLEPVDVPTECRPIWWTSALRSVPVQWPKAGCITSPGGLFTTMIAASSWSTSSGKGSGSTGGGSGTAT